MAMGSMLVALATVVLTGFSMRGGVRSVSRTRRLYAWTVVGSRWVGVIALLLLGAVLVGSMVEAGAAAEDMDIPDTVDIEASEDNSEWEE